MQEVRPCCSDHLPFPRLGLSWPSRLCFSPTSALEGLWRVKELGWGGRATSFLSRQDGGKRGRNDFGATASFSPGSCQLECYQIYPTFTRSYQQTVTINTCTTGHVAYVKPTVIKAISGVYTLRSKNEL